MVRCKFGSSAPACKNTFCWPIQIRSALNGGTQLTGKVQVHQNHFLHFHQKPISSKKNTFTKKPLSSKTSFIKKTLSPKNHFHQKPVSSKTTFIKNQFHQKLFSSETFFIRKNETKEWDSQYSPCLCEGVAGRRPATPSHKHGLCPPFGFQQAFMWSIAGRRPAMLHMKVC